jgi:fructosamine-3-kinase
VTLPTGARDARRVHGGHINDAYRVVPADGVDAFVKTRADAAAGEYASEAAGLRWRAERGALRTPRVLDVGERHLALEWIAAGAAPSERAFDAYHERAPLADGWRERVELYQLLPLLVHAVLFGGSYGQAVERAAARYAG